MNNITLKNSTLERFEIANTQRKKIVINKKRISTQVSTQYIDVLIILNLKSYPFIVIF